MSWNHRVMRMTSEGDGDSFGIHEVYYNADGTVENWTERAIAVYGEDVEDLRWALDRMIACLEKPILDYETGKEIDPQPQARKMTFSDIPQ